MSGTACAEESSELVQGSSAAKALHCSSLHSHILLLNFQGVSSHSLKDLKSVSIQKIFFIIFHITIHNDQGFP